MKEKRVTGTKERVGILGVGAYVPRRIMTNADWARLVETTDEWITSRTGIEQRRIAASEETTVDFAVCAAHEALNHAGLDVTSIDEIIVATDTPEVYVPDTASFVQHRLGARPIPAYDLAGSGCAGFLQALDIARSRCLDGSRTVLVIGVELLSKIINLKDRKTCVLFGDAAGAMIVGRRHGAAEILSAVTGTDGSQSDILKIEMGGTRTPFDHEKSPEGRLNITMKGQKVFREAVSRMTSASLEALTKAGVSIEEIALAIPHQANLRILQAVGKALKLPGERLFINVRNYGNTGSASIPLALHQALRKKRIHPGDQVLLTSFGAGFHWASVVLRF